MKTQIRESGIFIGIAFVFMAVLFFSACSSTQNNSGSSSTELSSKGAVPLYYDFGDIPIPKELSVIDKSTYIIEKSDGYPEGFLALKGRVTRNSLITYFKNGMANDNWQLVAVFKSPRLNAFMLFQKENRRCIIYIQEENLTTQVQVAVAPTVR